MSILEILRGEQPLFKSTSRANMVSEIEKEFPAFINHNAGIVPEPTRTPGENFLARAARAPFVHHPSDVRPDLHGTYDSLASNRDWELAKRGPGDLQSVRQLVVPVITAGEISGSPFNLGECTGILLAPRTVGDNGQEVESSDTARIYLQVNNSGVWIPFSFNLLAQGGQKGDATFIAGPIATLRIQVVVVTQDATFQPNMYLLLMRGFTIVGTFGAAVGYGPPQGGSVQTTTSAAASGPGPGGGGGTPGGGGGAPGSGGGGGGRGGGGGGRNLR